MTSPGTPAIIVGVIVAASVWKLVRWLRWRPSAGEAIARAEIAAGQVFDILDCSDRTDPSGQYVQLSYDARTLSPAEREAVADKLADWLDKSALPCSSLERSRLQIHGVTRIRTWRVLGVLPFERVDSEGISFRRNEDGKWRRLLRSA